MRSFGQHLFLGLALLLAAPFTLVAQTPTRYDRVRITLDGAAGGMEQLARLGLPVDHGVLKPGTWMETDLSTDQVELARTAGFTCTVLIPDVGRWYREQADAEEALIRTTLQETPGTHWQEFLAEWTVKAG